MDRSCLELVDVIVVVPAVTKYYFTNVKCKLPFSLRQKDVVVVRLLWELLHAVVVPRRVSVGPSGTDPVLVSPEYHP